MLLSFCRLCSCSGMRCRILFGSVSCSEPGAILLLFSLLKNALTNGIYTPSRRVSRPLDIALVSYSVSFVHIMFHVPELGFPVCLILPLLPQTIPILASHAWIGQLVAG